MKTEEIKKLCPPGSKAVVVSAWKSAQKNGQDVVGMIVEVIIYSGNDVKLRLPRKVKCWYGDLSDVITVCAIRIAPASIDNESALLLLKQF